MPKDVRVRAYNRSRPSKKSSTGCPINMLLGMMLIGVVVLIVQRIY